VFNFDQPAMQIAVIEGALREASMTDQWNEELHCPQCHNTGVVSLSQPKHAEMPTVDGIPDGFKAIHTEYGPNFHCRTCDFPVNP
jgi:hypothetical protein